jgi:hypothetical protein
MNEFKRGYKPRNNLLKDENDDLLADSHSILNRWKNYFSQLLNVHNVRDVRQIEVHMAETLVPGSSRLVVEIAIATLKMHKLPDSDKIPSELIQAGGETLLSGIHKLINSVWNKKELRGRWKESITVPIYKKGNKTDCCNYQDRLCGLVVRVLGYRSGGPGSILGTTRKKSSRSGTGSTQPREYN